MVVLFHITLAEAVQVTAKTTNHSNKYGLMLCVVCFLLLISPGCLCSCSNKVVGCRYYTDGWGGPETVLKENPTEIIGCK